VGTAGTGHDDDEAAAQAAPEVLQRAYGAAAGVFDEDVLAPLLETITPPLLVVSLVAYRPPPPPSPARAGNRRRASAPPPVQLAPGTNTTPVLRYMVCETTAASLGEYADAEEVT